MVNFSPMRPLVLEMLEGMKYYESASNCNGCNTCDIHVTHLTTKSWDEDGIIIDEMNLLSMEQFEN